MAKRKHSSDNDEIDGTSSQVRYFCSIYLMTFSCSLGSNASQFQATQSLLTRPSSSESSISTVVASHYNNIEEKGLIFRNKSRIVYMRNFNNWIKSMLISKP